ncbi:MAG: tryptophan--tRNA ligase [Defluviitaleaceae bacterium]|nr:tryptophan--tRNA ligase [Defluviitaleaceae bacterium]
MNTKPIIFSGLQATGIPTLGSLLGAIRNWARLTTDYNCLYCVVDMHSMTIRQDPAALRNYSRMALAWFVALGLDPKECTLYFQSHVPAHAELAWILNCFTYVGELNRMTQFKDKSAKNEDNINAGLYTYPVLQAADILLYQANLVPVGEDQRQHLELCRDIAMRFNKIYGDIFTVPEAYIPPVGAKIMGLQNPEKKMSKSETENEGNLVSLSDTDSDIIKKFKRAVTDSDNEIRFAPEKPGISNLLTIYACATGKTIPESEAYFSGMGYGQLKMGVGEAVVAMLKPYRDTYDRLMADNAYLDSVITQGAQKARAMSEVTLKNVKQAIGYPMQPE